MALHLVLSRRSVSLVRPPRLGVLPEGDPPGVRRHVLPGDDGGGHLVEPLLPVDLPGEVPRVLLARGVPVACPPLAVLALLDACHHLPPISASIARASGVRCPPRLPRPLASNSRGEASRRAHESRSRSADRLM